MTFLFKNFREIRIGEGRLGDMDMRREEGRRDNCEKC